jgi:hypothetical protein
MCSVPLPLVPLRLILILSFPQQDSEQSTSLAGNDSVEPVERTRRPNLANRQTLDS